MKFLKKLSLEEQITKVKEEAKLREITCSSANLAYTKVAVDIDYPEAAEHFLNKYFKEKVNHHFGVEE